MKKLIYVSVVSACMAVSSFGSIVTFSDWKTAGFGDLTGTTNTAAITTNGVTFSVTAVTSENLNMNAAGTLWGVGGNTRMNAGESVALTLAVSGAELTSLSLDALNILYFAKVGEQFSASDGISTNSFTAPPIVSSLTYGTGNNLEGLTALDKDNTGAWELTITALPASGVDPTDFGISSMSFEYTVIPEPATLGLVASVGVGIFFIRRKFMI